MNQLHPFDQDARTRRTSNMVDGDHVSELLHAAMTTSAPGDRNSSESLFDGPGPANDSSVQPYKFYKAEQLTFLCVLFALIVVGNVSVLVAIFLSKNRKSRMNFFITQLAVADLTSGLVTVLTEIIWKTTVEWHAGTTGCKIVRYLQSVATYASTYVLVALSIDRLDAIARPMKFSGSGTRAKILIAVAWGLSSIFSLPMLILCKEKTKRGIRQCQIFMPVAWGWKFYMTMLGLILFIIPAVIICSCYCIIVSVIWRKGTITAPRTENKRNGASAREVAAGEESHASSRGLIPKARIKTIKMTLVIVLAFIFCWSPYFIFDLLDVYGMIPFSQRKIAVAIFIQSLSSLNSAANPVIYCLFSTRICSNLRRFPFCDRLAKILCCLRRSKLPRYNADLTEYTSITLNDKSQAPPGSQRRHSGTPYVKVMLSERDNQILLKHIRSSGSGGDSGSDKDPGLETGEDASSAL